MPPAGILLVGFGKTNFNGQIFFAVEPRGVRLDAVLAGRQLVAAMASRTRHCSACGRVLGAESFSRNQWSKPVGVSRCHACVASNSTAGAASMPPPPPAKSARPSTARRNDATQATFQNHDLDHPFSSGTFRWVARGVYTHGERAGESCVCKWFKVRFIHLTDHRPPPTAPNHQTNSATFNYPPPQNPLPPNACRPVVYSKKSFSRTISRQSKKRCTWWRSGTGKGLSTRLFG